MKKYQLSASELIDGVNELTLTTRIFKLKERVVPENLVRAVNEAIRLHPIYKTKIVMNGDVPELAENDLNPVVKKRKSDRAVELCTKELNHYPWRIFYREDEIVLCVSHMISDARGGMNFMKTVLRLYFEKCGTVFQSAGEWDRAENPEETTCNPFAKYGNGKIRTMTEKGGKEPFKIDKRLLEKDTPERPTYFLEFRKDDLKALAKKTETGVFAILSYFFAKAAESVMKPDKGSVRILVPYDCRIKFPTATDKSFAYVVPLDYDIASLGSRALEDVAKEFKGQLVRHTAETNLLAYFGQMVKKEKELKENPEKLFRCKDTFDKDKMCACGFYTHISKTPFPEELENLIADFSAQAHLIRDNIMFLAYGTTYGDKITVSIRDVFKGDAFAESLKSHLKKEGIEFRFHAERLKLDLIVPSPLRSKSRTRSRENPRQADSTSLRRRRIPS